ncbi:MAG: carboxypeptidase regulatory-like domain-containing protein [Prolixibacteraceae bacterium]|jgi:hypothetical protein
MKTLIISISFVLSAMVLQAQETSPIPNISEQITNYFSTYPREKVFVTTNKSHYKPGETIWFSAIVTDAANRPDLSGNRELHVRLYDTKGNPVVKDIFKVGGSATHGDLQIPDELGDDNYYLVAHTAQQTSVDEISMCTLIIDPLYSNQWLAETKAKDSIFVAGQKNEVSVALKTVSGEVLKNTQLRYQLLNGSEIIEKDKLKTDANGNVTIPITIPDKTNGEPFVCLLTDSRENWMHQIFLPTNLDPVVISFYPECGHLISGIPAKIGFTAFNKWGVPVDIEGSVIDQQGKPVAMVKSITSGLGIFSFDSEENQKYQLKISGKTGTNQTFNLPEQRKDGLALSVIKSDHEFISANLIFADKQKHAVALTVTNGTTIYWSADMEINGIGRIKIPADNLPNGINMLTAFEKNGTVLANRLIFQDKTEYLKIDIQPEKTVIHPDQKMNVKVSFADEKNKPIAGNIMISISDKFSNKPEKPKIEECLQVSSELENPFSLIADATENSVSNSSLMDLFLISNRLKAFDWNKILTYKAGSSADLNDRNNSISGFVTDKNGEKIYRAKVSLVNNKSMQIFTTTTNDDGRFTFQNLNAANIDDFTAKATDLNGKKELKLEYDKNFDAKISNLISHVALKNNLLHKDQFVDATYYSNNPKLFTKAPKQVKVSTSAAEAQQRLLMSSTNLLDVIKTMKPYNLVNNQIVFIGSENSLYYQSGALIVLDGQQMGTDASAIQSISPSEVDHVNISTNPVDIQRYTGLNNVGVIEVFLKNAKSVEMSGKQLLNTNQYDGIYRIPNEFTTVTKNDDPATILWIPFGKTDQTGVYEFMVTVGKLISNFEISVQGITDDGRMSTAKSVFSVVK